MAKKTKARTVAIGHACRLRIVRGRRKPHGPNGVQMRFEIEFDQRNTTALEADILRKRR